MLGIPETSPRLSDLLGQLTGLSMQSRSWLWSTTVRRYQVKWAKQKGTEEKVEGKPDTRSQESPPGTVTRAPQQWVVTTQVKWPPRKLISDSAPGYLLEAGCADDLCPACAQIPGSQKVSICSAWIVLLAQFRHRRHSYQFGKWSEQSQNPSC